MKLIIITAIIVIAIVFFIKRKSKKSSNGSSIIGSNSIESYEDLGTGFQGIDGITIKDTPEGNGIDLPEGVDVIMDSPIDNIKPVKPVMPPKPIRKKRKK